MVGWLCVRRQAYIYIHTEQVKDALFVITSCIKSKRTRAEKNWQWGLTQEKPEVEGRVVLFMKFVYAKTVHGGTEENHIAYKVKMKKKKDWTEKEILLEQWIERYPDSYKQKGLR